MIFGEGGLEVSVEELIAVAQLPVGAVGGAGLGGDLGSERDEIGVEGDGVEIGVGWGGFGEFGETGGEWRGGGAWGGGEDEGIAQAGAEAAHFGEADEVEEVARVEGFGRGLGEACGEGDGRGLGEVAEEELAIREGGKELAFEAGAAEVGTGVLGGAEAEKVERGRGGDFSGRDGGGEDVDV